MVRISAIFISTCMVLIAGSLGFVVYLRFGFTGAESALVALGTLTALAVYNAISARKNDRLEASNQLANLARGSDDLARQLAEFGRRLSAVEVKVETVVDRALATAQPLAAEIEEMSALVKQLADSVAMHETAISNTVLAVERRGYQAPQAQAASAAPVAAAPPVAPASLPSAVAAAPVAQAASAPPPIDRNIPAFAGFDRDGIIAAIRRAIDSGRIDLFLQPVVTLPQRKVRYYEALSRLKADNGDLVLADDFLDYAEAGRLMPSLDNLSVVRCVQVVRRLLLKSRDVGLFCNLSSATLTDSSFPKFLEFMEANRAIAPALVFEFTQSAVRAMGPIEHESLAALAERGYRFSIDNLTDLRVEARELNERGFRFVKAPAALLFNRVGLVSTDIHPADFSDLLGRFGIDLIADHIESESTVVDLLDFDVRFGQGMLFSPPRPVRAEALQAVSEAPRETPFAPAANDAPPPAPAAAPAGNLAQLARAFSRRV
ncbi:MAG TPA: EAL domain-containing protein [Xanthobacteraceae bacterium]|jgi:cyclic-di-GMP phosphodiesterase TipF (flagellum assembly factor)|nr:EAL domain-containing protein [Xanthobacteraceae bacterium]